MWLGLLGACIMAVLLLYGPGYVFFRGIAFSPIIALCCAPLFCVGMYAGLPLLYYEFGISCNLATILVPTLLVAFVVRGLPLLHRRFVSTGTSQRISLSTLPTVRVLGRAIPSDIVLPILFVVLATIVCVCVFGTTLPSAQAFAPRRDNQMHLNLVRAFYDSGCWSSLHPSVFLASPESARPIHDAQGFYPSAWHCLVVMCALAAQADLMVAANALIIDCTCIVFPLAFYLLMRILFPNQQRIVALGAIAMTGVGVWPWLFLYTGPLYPNQLGNSLLPAFVAMLILLFEHGRAHKRMPVLALIASGFVSFVALALAHPSTLFSSYVVMAAYGAHVVIRSTQGKRRIALTLGYVALVVAFWVLCYQLPMLRGTIDYMEDQRNDVGVVIASLLSLDISSDAPHVAMLICIVLGCIATARNREVRWLLLPVAFFAVGFVATRADWWLLKHWLAGIWYSDHRRLIVNMALCAMPLAALGLDTVLSRPQPLRYVLSAVLVACIYMPSVPLSFFGLTIQTPYGSAHAQLYKRYHQAIYAPEEVAFVDRAKSLIPHNALVINVPIDGTVWAYGVNGLNTYYRNIWQNNFTDEARIISQGLHNYTTDDEVRKAIQKTGARYVLLLDKDVPYDEGTWLWQVEEQMMSEWTGISSIDEHTPGFTLLASEGSDMRLYRIDL